MVATEAELSREDAVSNGGGGEGTVRRAKLKAA